MNNLMPTRRNEFLVRRILNAGEGDVCIDGELVMGVATMDRAAAEGARSLDDENTGTYPCDYGVRHGGEHHLLVEDWQGKQARYVIRCRVECHYDATRETKR